MYSSVPIKELHLKLQVLNSCFRDEPHSVYSFLLCQAPVDDLKAIISEIDTRLILITPSLSDDPYIKLAMQKVASLYQSLSRGRIRVIVSSCESHVFQEISDIQKDLDDLVFWLSECF